MEQEEPVWAREDCGIPHTKPRIQSKVLNVLEGDRFVFIHDDLKFNDTLQQRTRNVSLFGCLVADLMMKWGIKVL